MIFSICSAQAAYFIGVCWHQSHKRLFSRCVTKYGKCNHVSKQTAFVRLLILYLCYSILKYLVLFNLNICSIIFQALLVSLRSKPWWQTIFFWFCTFLDCLCDILACNLQWIHTSCSITVSVVTQEWRSRFLPSWMGRTLILEVINLAWELSWMHKTSSRMKRSQIMLNGKLLEREFSTHIHPLILLQFKLSTEPKPEPCYSDSYLLYVHRCDPSQINLSSDPSFSVHVCYITSYW